MTISERVAKIPGLDGWWKSDNQERFENLARLLCEKGFTEEEAVSFLADVYTATSSEYGN